MPGKSPHAHERPAWHTPAQHPCTGQRPGAAARPHPRGMSFCPSKAISHPVPKPRLRGLSRAMAPRPSLPTGTLRANAFPVPRETRGKSPRREPTDHIQRRKPHQKPRAERARGLSLARHRRSHQQTTLRAAKGTGIPGAQAHPPKGEHACRMPRAPPRERLPSPAKRAEKSPRRGPRPLTNPSQRPNFLITAEKTKRKKPPHVEYNYINTTRKKTRR